MKRVITLYFFICFFAGYSPAQRDIVISTDCAFDDMRAICQFLAVREINIKAIISSDGMLPPDKGRTKVLALLNDFEIKNIPVGEGKTVQKNKTKHYSSLMSLKWGNEVQVTGISLKAEELLKRVFSESVLPLTVICMGPLTDIYAFVKNNPEMKVRIKNIIWYNVCVKPLSGTNYEFDKKAVEALMNEKIEMHIISNLESNHAVLNKQFFSELEAIDTRFAKKISMSADNDFVRNMTDSGYCRMWDDLLPVFYLYPGLFYQETLLGNPSVSYTKDVSFDAVKEKIFQILSGNYSLEKNITFERFPADDNDYQYDVRQIKKEAINRYGEEEWRVCVLTNEIHGHLGTYSLIGAKMGIYAREILNAEIDRLEVVSDAGILPPLSCMNDGMQISTGATLGLGTIKITEGNTPSATFSYNGRKIKLTLKSEISGRIEKDISDAVIKFGGLTDGYWKLIRVISLQHWLELDRNEIFEMEEIK